MMDDSRYEVLSFSPSYPIKKPSLSILLLDYIQHDFSTLALNSVINQDLSYEDFELIILTDERDNEVLSTVSLSRLNYMAIFTDLVSVGESLAIGAKVARGKIICPLDNDDEWTRGRLRIISQTFKAIPGLVFLKNEIQPIGNMARSSSRLSFYLRMNVPFRATGDMYELNDHTPRRIFGRSLSHNSSSMSIRKELLLADLNDISLIRAFPDSYLLFLSASSGGRLFFLDEQLTLYRPRSDSLSSRGFRTDSSGSSLHAAQRKQHLDAFKKKLTDCKSTRILDLFFMFEIVSAILLTINGYTKERISISQMIRFLRISIDYGAHQFLFSVALYFLYRLKNLVRQT